MVYRAICRNTDRKGAQTQHRKGACWAGGSLLLVGSACVRGRGSVCVCVLAYAKISYEMCCEIQFSWIFIYFASLLARGTLVLTLSLSLSLPLTLASIPQLVTDTNRCTQVLVYHSCRSCDALSLPSTHNSTCSRRGGKLSEGCGGMFPRCLIFLIDQMSFFSPFPIPFCFCVFSFFFLVFLLHISISLPSLLLCRRFA